MVQLFCGLPEEAIWDMDDETLADLAARAFWRHNLAIELISLGVQKAIAELFQE